MPATLAKKPAAKAFSIKTAMKKAAAKKLASTAKYAAPKAARKLRAVDITDEEDAALVNAVSRAAAAAFLAK